MPEAPKIALFGLHRGTGTDPATLTRQARLAEDAGFESLWIGDHLILPEDQGETPRLEAVVALTYLAAVTTHIGLAAGVLVLPQRHPVLLAKQLASIDVLSNGRLTIGIGVGYVESELRALGVSLTDRAARTDEYLTAMQTLWHAEPEPFEGTFVSFAGVQRPLPVQRPHPPIVIGAQTPPAYRRVVQRANGWYGWNLDLDQTAQALTDLRAAEAKHGRPAELGDLDITVTPRGEIDLDAARRYADLGVHRLAVQPQSLEDGAMDALIASVGESVIGRL